MNQRSEMDDVPVISQLIRDLNQTWLQGRFDDLHRYYVEDVVMIPPGLQGEVVGRDAMVDSYRQFAQQATVHQFREDRIDVHTFESTAIVTLHFHVKYDCGGDVQEENGAEILVLLCRDNEWRIAWRTQIPAEPEKKK